VIELRQVTVEEAQAVVAFAPLGFAHVHDWPHADTYDALRPLAEHGGGPGTFFVVEDGEVVGDCGWFGPPDEDGEVEIGYGLAPSARGRGLGTAAVRLLLDWVTAAGARSVRAEVLPGNEVSLRLLARLGFEDVGEHAGHRVLVR
jgi:RimJ/RimL family protein N-acetyltransferase